MPRPKQARKFPKQFNVLLTRQDVEHLESALELAREHTGYDELTKSDVIRRALRYYAQALVHAKDKGGERALLQAV